MLFEVRFPILMRRVLSILVAWEQPVVIPLPTCSLVDIPHYLLQDPAPSIHCQSKPEGVEAGMVLKGLFGQDGMVDILKGLGVVREDGIVVLLFGLVFPHFHTIG